MKFALVMLLTLTGCTFSGEVTPDLECTSTCEDDKQICHDECTTECVNAEGDADEACDTDCRAVCDESFDECTVTCTDA